MSCALKNLLEVRSYVCFTTMIFLKNEFWPCKTMLEVIKYVQLFLILLFSYKIFADSVNQVFGCQQQNQPGDLNQK